MARVARTVPKTESCTWSQGCPGLEAAPFAALLYKWCVSRQDSDFLFGGGHVDGLTVHEEKEAVYTGQTH